MKTHYKEIRNDNTKLLIYVHGVNAKASTSRAWLKDCVQHSEFDIIAPKLPYHRLVSFKRINAVINELADNLSLFTAQKKYASITLIGHSLGAQVIRGLYLRGWTETKTSTQNEPEFERISELDWIDSVDRIIYIAGLHRGWTLEGFTKRIPKIKFSLLDFLGETLSFVTFGKFRASSLDSKSGDPALTHIRLKALRINQYFSQKGSPSGPNTIQILGSQDDLISPDRQIDVTPDLDMRIIEIPNSGHIDILKTPRAFGLSSKKPSGNFEKGSREYDLIHKKRQKWKYPQLRMQNFQKAIHANWPELQKDKDNIFGIIDYSERGPDENISDIIFIIHGIRDYAFWTAKLGRFIRGKALNHQNPKISERKYKTATPKYGYFPILDFVFPGLRASKVAWLTDQYVSYRALYPNADFHYIGHSNGTQIFAEALSAHPDLSFKHVVLAGSVIRKDFPWENYVGTRIERVLNLVASRDTVVALFPGGLQFFKYFKLGSAGHDGFNYARSTSIDPNEFREIKYVNGGHGAGIAYEAWDYIAQFVLSGKPRGLPENHIGKQTAGVRFTGKFSTLILGILIAMLGALIYALTQWGLLRHFGSDTSSSCKPVTNMRDFGEKLISSISKLLGGKDVQSCETLTTVFLTQPATLPTLLVATILIFLWFMARKF